MRFRGDYETLYDQAGLMLRRDAETWIKAGVEYVAERRMLSAVVTREVSDWSTMPAPTDAPWLLLRLTRIGSAVHVHWAAEDGALPHVAAGVVPRGAGRRSARWPARPSAPAFAPSSATSASGRPRTPAEG